MNLNINSDSATEPDSDDFAAVLEQAPNDVLNSPSQRKAPKSSMHLIEDPLVPMGDSSQINTPALRDEVALPSSFMTGGYSEEDEGGSRSRTPTPMREFLNMVEGDGTFPDDFPESWRD